jgi:hypothetical protein
MSSYELPRLAINFEAGPTVQPEDQLYVAASHDILPPVWVGERELGVLLSLGRQAMLGTTPYTIDIAKSMNDRVAFNAETGCWELPTYQDDKKRARYGLINGGAFGTRNLAHRITLENLSSNELRLGRFDFVDHLCQNKSCCNPRHLEPVSPAENNRRGRQTIHDAHNATLPLLEHEHPPRSLTLKQAQLRFAHKLRKWPWLKLANTFD